MAEAGQFPEAITTANRAVKLTISRNDTAGTEEVRRQLGCYEKGLPYRDPLQTGAAAGAVH